MTTLEERPLAAQEQAPDARWQAVLARDQRYDGAFVYGVRSTGVYCRPSCPSRSTSPRLDFLLCSVLSGFGY